MNDFEKLRKEIQESASGLTVVMDERPDDGHVYRNVIPMDLAEFVEKESETVRTMASALYAMVTARVRARIRARSTMVANGQDEIHLIRIVAASPGMTLVHSERWALIKNRFSDRIVDVEIDPKEVGGLELVALVFEPTAELLKELDASIGD